MVLEDFSSGYRMPEIRKSVIMPNELKVILIIVLVTLLFWNNGIFLFMCFLAVMLIVSILWKPYRPSILLFCFLMQWMQVVAYVLWLNSMGITINEKYKTVPFAIIEALLSTVLMAVTVNYMTRKSMRFTFDELAREARKWDKRKVLILYALSTVFLSSVGFIFSDMKSGVTQILVTIQDIKWLFLMVYGIILWSTNGRKNIFWLICLYEFVISFYSYFSDFKTVIFLVLLLLLTFTYELDYRKAISIFFLAIAMGFLFLTWTAIKGEYRNYLSSGRRLQKVYVSKNEAFQNMFYKISKLDKSQYEKTLSAALYRVQYILHLNRVMQRIPSAAPHEYGNLWKSNIEYVFLPRALFPDKKMFDPSMKTNKYTGFKYATGKSGVAFSLGYYAESYVDFGHVWMILPLLVIAMYVSIIFNTIMTNKSLNLLTRFAMVTNGLMVFATIEADGIFLIGRLTMNFIIMLLLTYTVFPSIQRWAYLPVPEDWKD
jgi:hypothetical protein